MMNIKKQVLGFVIGGTVATTIGVLGGTILSSQVSYSPTKSIQYGATSSIDKVDKAVNDLLVKVNNLPNKRFLDGEIVYYNPVTDSKCTDYHVDNSLTEYKADAASKTTDNQTGCLRWFAYKDTNASSGATGTYAYGYWTKTNAGSGSYVWDVHFHGDLNLYSASAIRDGVRPVVIVQKSKLL